MIQRPYVKQARRFSVWVVSAFLSISAASRGECVDQFGNRHDLVGPSPSFTVVYFAASWCEACYHGLPKLQDLAGEHQEVRFLVVSVDDEVGGRDQLVEDLELRLPVVWDEGQSLIGRFHPRGFPALYVLDPAGEVVYHHVGSKKKKWRDLLELLARLSQGVHRIG